jgi:O-antigen/teichoic acid export membrane protein
MTSIAKKAKNVAILSFAAYIEYIAGFAASVLVARTLGPSLFGSYAFVVWLVGQLILFGLHGVNLTTVKFVGRSIGSHEEEQLAALIRYLRNVCVISCASVFLMYAAASQYLPIQELPFNIWIAGGFIILASIFRATYRFNLAIAQAIENYQVGAIAQSVSAIAYTIMVTSLLFVEVNIVYYLIAYIITSGVQCALIFFKPSTLKGLKPQVQKLSDEMRREVNKYLLFGAQFVIVSGFLWGAVEFFVLKKFATIEEVTFFSVALTLAKAASDLCVGAFASTLTPVLAKLMFDESKVELNSILSESVALFTLLATIITCLAVVALPSVTTLFYGAKYVKAIPYICIMMIFTALQSTYTPLAAYQMVNDKPSERMIQSMFSAGLNIVLALIIIPRYGIEGAVFCFCLNMLVYPAVGWFFVRKEIQVNIRKTFFLQLFIFALIATSVGYFVSSLNFTFAFVPASLICLAVLLGNAIIFKTFPSHYFTNALVIYKKLTKGSSKFDKLAKRLSILYGRPLDH